MPELCHKRGCDRISSKQCSACKEACYCSVECQKEDWKVHKTSCVNINKLPLTFLSINETYKYISKTYAQVNILEETKPKEAISMLQKLQSFIERQWGTPIEGTSQYRRSNGDEIDDAMLVSIRITLSILFSDIKDLDSELSYSTEARQMLEPRDRSEDSSLLLLWETERNLASVYMKKGMIPEAERYCERSLMFAKLIKGPGQVDSECHSLKLYAVIRGLQSQLPAAIILSERAYILACRLHGPVYPCVQEIVNTLIQHLIANGDLSRAEEYCRRNYKNLTDRRYHICSEGCEIIESIQQLAEIWLKKESAADEAAFALAEEAEQLTRKTCKMIEKQYGRNSKEMGVYYRILGDILLQREKYTEETSKILELSLILTIQYMGIDDRQLVLPYKRLAHYHDRLSAMKPSGDARNYEVEMREKYVESAREIEERIDDLTISIVKPCNNV